MTELDVVAEQFSRKCQAAVCLDAVGAPIAAFGPIELLRYLALAAKSDGGLLAPAEHKVADLLAAVDLSGTWVAMPASDPVALAVDRLMQKGVDLIVGLDDGGAVAGIIPRALRRY